MRKDKRTIKAKKEGLRARSAYKLQELNDKYHFLERADHILDLGSWPGGWSVVAVEHAPVTAVDINYQQPIEGVDFVQGDLFDNKVLDRLPPADVVLSDAMAKTSGDARDQYLSYELSQRVLLIALSRLRAKGSFICKIFQGPDFDDFLSEVRKYFDFVKCTKPVSSKGASKEMYIVAMRFKGR